MKERQFNLLRWTPVGASVVLAVMIAVISVATVSELKRVTHWREQTFQVILDAQTFENRLIDAQSSVRGYVGRGQADLLIAYKHDTNLVLQELNQLTELTHKNPAQQERLKNLAAAVQTVFAYDSKVIGIYAQKGTQAATQADETTKGEDARDRAINDLEQFTDGERELLNKRDATEQKEYHFAADMLIFGSMLVTGLLILANVVASREMARRRRAELEQRELIGKLEKALAEVKTLSGLIPICGWCKKVRNDAGYWQSVEQYVRAHTDATFSHGICPDRVASN